MGKELKLRRFRDVTRNVKGSAKRRRLVRNQKLKTKPINSYASNRSADPKGLQGSESDMPRAVQTNTILPVPER
jgi:hypothetical protein